MESAMFTIRLFCAAGMSTSLLERRIRDAAKERGIEVDVAAHPASEMDGNLDGVDAALIGPQVQFMFKQLEEKCAAKQVPVAVIPMREYGTVNGEKVLDLALEIAGR